VITGFNTDVEHDGVVYHVQTEDKGLDSPFILSLVYSGGAILASKRSRYEDLIASGFSDEALSERLKRQHRLICAAIHSGRLNDLKKMSARGSGPAVSEVEENADEGVAELDVEISPISQRAKLAPPDISAEEEQSAFSLKDDSAAPSSWHQPVLVIPQEELAADTQQESSGIGRGSPEDAAYSIHDPRRQSPMSQPALADEGLILSLLDEEEFYSGDAPTLRVLVSNRSGKDNKPLGNVSVSIKILGTTFRPQIYSLKTQKNGVAIVETQIPHFTSGRAAVLIRVIAKGGAAELRRIIHPGK